MTFTCSNPPYWIFMDILMSVGHFVQMTKEIPVAMASSLVLIQCHGPPMNKRLSRSSIESEYRALAFAASKIIWIQSILQEICLPSSSLPLLWCDNKSATHLATNLVFHPRTKHIELDLHFIRDRVLHKQLIIQYILSSEQVANIFTKHITSSQSLSFKTKLFVVPSPMSLQGDDRQYLADQQEEYPSHQKLIARDQLQQTKTSYKKQKSVKNVFRQEVSQLRCCQNEYKNTSVQVRNISSNTMRNIHFLQLSF